VCGNDRVARCRDKAFSVYAENLRELEALTGALIAALGGTGRDGGTADTAAVEPASGALSGAISGALLRAKAHQ
jgi:hypothetical protein